MSANALVRLCVSNMVLLVVGCAQSDFGSASREVNGPPQCQVPLVLESLELPAAPVLISGAPFEFRVRYTVSPTNLLPSCFAGQVDASERAVLRTALSVDTAGLVFENQIALSAAELASGTTLEPSYTWDGTGETGQPAVGLHSVTAWAYVGANKNLQIPHRPHSQLVERSVSLVVYETAPTPKTPDQLQAEQEIQQLTAGLSDPPDLDAQQRIQLHALMRRVFPATAARRDANRVAERARVQTLSTPTGIAVTGQQLAAWDQLVADSAGAVAVTWDATEPSVTTVSFGRTRER